MKAIEIQNLEFGYSGGSNVLQIPILEIGRGEKVFLRGASGSGKTTLLNILGGILPFTKGEVNVLGKSLKTMSGAEKDQFRADHLGFIFQTLHLIPYLSPLENILLPTQFSARKKSLIDKERVSVLCKALRLNMDDLQTKKTYQLSLGQQQRVAVARALIGNPEIIIADEPTSSIDREARDQFLELLFSLARERAMTIVFVSHDPTLESHFDRSIHLAEVNTVTRMKE
jgi:putative ABC transport system ATP-binding protein